MPVEYKFGSLLYNGFLIGIYTSVAIWQHAGRPTKFSQNQDNVTEYEIVHSASGLVGLPVEQHYTVSMSASTVPQTGTHTDMTLDLDRM